MSDAVYRLGWEHVTTAGCPRKKCKCYGSGECTHGKFCFFLLLPDDIKPLLTLLATPPFVLDPINCEEMSIEEVTCCEDTLAESYEYIVGQVVDQAKDEQLVSVALGDTKTFSFVMSCYLVKLRLDKFEGSGVAVDVDGKCAWVLSMDERILMSFLVSLSYIGVKPMLLPDKLLRVSIRGSGRSAESVVMSTGIFRPRAIAPAVVLCAGGDSTELEASSSSHKKSVLAVRTATVTASIVLTPISLYGGVNPSTKRVSCVAHSVEM